MFRTPAALLTVIVMLALSTSALAGGWATVRLDEAPTGLVAGTPWQFGFMVLQHGVTPNSDVSPVVRAIHRETGEVVTAVARQDGPAGHFVAELTLPRAGEWQWSIAPRPFAETSFTSLTVREEPVATPASMSAGIRAGSCT